MTIEQSEEIPDELAPLIGNKLYGCDTCQEVCPWNKFARPTEVSDFAPRNAIMGMNAELLEEMKDSDFELHFAGSPVRRAGLKGLQRTLRAIKKNPNKDK